MAEHIESLDAGLRVMMMFATRDTLSITSVVNQLGISRSTAYRLLNTLKDRGVVSLGPTGRGYHPGPALVDMARPMGIDIRARERYRAVIADAVVRTGETVHVATLVGSQVLFFDGMEADRAVRVGLRIGYLRPAYASAAGKLLLSSFIPEQIRSLYPGEFLPRFTKHTLGSVSELLDELAEIREKNYATVIEEMVPSLSGVAIVLQGRSWRDRVALLASIPSQRADSAYLATMAEKLEESRHAFPLQSATGPITDS